MSLINITDVQVANNPGRFTDDFNFKITFECMSELAEGNSYQSISLSDPHQTLPGRWTRQTGRLADHSQVRAVQMANMPCWPDIEWKLIYIVTTNDGKEFEQELDTCSVGPIPVGVNSFEFEVKSANMTQTTTSLLIGMSTYVFRPRRKHRTRRNYQHETSSDPTSCWCGPRTKSKSSSA